MGDIWVTSDLHLFHDKGFLYEPRGFNSVYDMNDAIITNWNKLVKPNDDVYVLGDCVLNNNEAGVRLMKSLVGNIHIIIGNHDSDQRLTMYNECYNVVEIEFAQRLKVGNWRFYLTHYPTLVGDYDDAKAPTRQLYNLCGHTHTSDMWCDWDKGRIIHTEMDTNNCTPWNIEQIIEGLRGKV